MGRNADRLSWLAARLAWIGAILVIASIIGGLMAAHAQSRRGCSWVTGSECGPAPGERTCTWPDRNGEMVDHCEDRRQPAAYRPTPEPEAGARYGRPRHPEASRDRRDARGAAGMTVHAVVCDADESLWQRRLREASEEIERAGGQPLRAGGIVRGCPRSVEEIRGHQRQLGGGVIFALFRSADQIRANCRGTDGCAEMGGNIGFLSGLQSKANSRLLLHEIGHMLGFSHSSDASSLMYPYVNPQSAVSVAYVDRQRRWSWQGNGGQVRSRIVMGGNARIVSRKGAR